MQINNLIDEKALAKLLCVSVHTLRSWRFWGGGPPYLKLGKTVRYDPQSVLEWCKSSEVLPTPEPTSNPERSKYLKKQIEKCLDHEDGGE